MLKRYRRLFFGLALTTAVVVLCLLLPGVFLHMEGEKAVGTPQQAQQRYYADNISAEDAVGFDLNVRLMMYSGQWKSQKEAISVDAVAENDHILSKPSMRRYGATLFMFLADRIWTDAACEMLQAMDENAERYISMLLGYSDVGDGADTTEAYEDAGRFDAGTADADNAGEGEAEADPYGETQAYSSTSGFVQILEKLALEDAQITLYRYEDQVLNSYYFYVWEYVIRDEALGVDVVMDVDAVTLELYHISFHGSLFDNLPWVDALQLMMEYSMEDLNVYMDHYWSSTGMHFPANHAAVIPAFLSSCWMGMQGVTRGFAGSAPFSMTDSDNTLETRESGYSFFGGNFFFVNAPVQCYMLDDWDWIAMEDSQDNVVYAYAIYRNGGFEWTMTAERSQDA